MKDKSSVVEPTNILALTLFNFQIFCSVENTIDRKYYVNYSNTYTDDGSYKETIAVTFLMYQRLSKYLFKIHPSSGNDFKFKNNTKM